MAIKKSVSVTSSGVELKINGVAVANIACAPHEVPEIEKIFLERGYRDAAVYVSSSQTASHAEVANRFRNLFPDHTCDVCKAHEGGRA
jgi:hypothetical protein